MSRQSNPVAIAMRELLDDETTLVHETYRHLDRRITLFAGLTISQTFQLLASALLGYALSKLLPLPSPYDLTVGLTIGGIPATIALVTAGSDFQLLDLLRGLISWRRQAGIYEPGTDPASPPHGYHLAAGISPSLDQSRGAIQATADQELDELWT